MPQPPGYCATYAQSLIVATTIRGPSKLDFYPSGKRVASKKSLDLDFVFGVSSKIFNKTGISFLLTPSPVRVPPTKAQEARNSFWTGDHLRPLVFVRLLSQGRSAIPPDLHTMLSRSPMGGCPVSSLRELGVFTPGSPSRSGRR